MNALGDCYITKVAYCFAILLFQNNLMFGILGVLQRIEEGEVLEIRAELVLILAVLTLAAIILLCLLVEILYEDTVDCSSVINQALYDYKLNY